MVSERPTWAKKLLGKMKENDITQAEMAKELDVTETTFSRMINGKAAPPDVYECCKMCNKLNCTLNDIFLTESC